MKRLFLILLIAYANLVNAQSNSFQQIISGKVVTEKNRPIDFATVSLLYASDSSLLKTTFSDEKGNYQFENIKDSTYIIAASLVGYRNTYSQKFKLNNQQNYKVSALTLPQESKNLKEVSITAQKPLIERRADKLILNVEASSTSVGSTALEVLQKAPGISLDKDDNIALKGKQGVLVMIDGKQTYMSNADLANMLRNMQSNEIESIEIITNPSSKYEAAGNSGIINIKLKKNKNFGTNGTINAGTGYGKNFKNNGGININNRNKKLNLFGNYNYSNNVWENRLDINRENISQNNLTYFNQTSKFTGRFRNNNFKAGADYSIDKNNILGVLITGYNNRGDEYNNNLTGIGSSKNYHDETLRVLSDSKGKYRNTAYNLNYKSTLDTNGKELSIDLDHSDYKRNDDGLYDNFLYDALGNAKGDTIFLNNNTPSKIKIYSIKADYTHPINKSLKVGLGVKNSWVKTDNDFRFNTRKNQERDWQNVANRSNHFIYDENVNAGYINVQKEFKKTNLQLGLRVEQTRSKGDLVTTRDVKERRYEDFFPSGSINHTFSDKHSAGISYSRRIKRPSYDALNPFEYYLDQYTYNQGNAFLKPEYTNSYELSYTYQQKYTITFGHSLTRDVITEVLIPDTIKKALYQTNENLARQINFDATINAPLKFTKWWSSNNNLTVFYMGFRAPDLKGVNLDNGKTVFQLYSNQQFKLSKTFSAELTGNYQSPLIYGTLDIKSQYGIDFGMSKTLADKKLTLKFAFSDILNTRENRLSSAFPGLNYTLHQKGESQVARFSISYRFGNNHVKAERQRATGLDSEARRMKN